MMGGELLMLVSYVDNLGFLQMGLQLSHQDLLKGVDHAWAIGMGYG